MLVYGDHDEQVRSAAHLGRIADRLQGIGAMAPGLERHSALVGALIEAGRLQQGLADAAFDDRDGTGSQAAEAGALTYGLGRCVLRSWESKGADMGELPAIADVRSMPAEVELRSPEGFAFYALYPEAFAEAARKLRLIAPPRVIGIRSIGTSLAAIAAAAIDAPPPVTVRPFGDPWARKIAVSDELAAKLLEGEAHYVIVDEGPGLSGSSFGAVVDWLRERDVPLERIAVLPSHAGAPGPSASAAHRQQWEALQRVPADLSPRLPELLRGWAETVLGPLDGPLIDLSGGQWRRWAIAREEDWPPADASLERRKYLAFANGETWLLKFAGLGREGGRKLELARRLHRAGLTPEPRGLVHGFVVQRWHGNAARLTREEAPVGAIGRYIGLRARELQGEACTGASMRELYAMAVQNFAEARVGTAIERWAGRLDEFEAAVRRHPTDNAMAPQEWLRLPDGEMLKSDALDHHRGHDLIGCQDIAWDVAGAIVEFGLDDDEASRLRGAAEQAWGLPVDPDLLQFCRLAYSAFRLGQLKFAVDRSYDDAEIGRIRNAARAVRRQLERESQLAP